MVNYSRPLLLKKCSDIDLNFTIHLVTFHKLIEQVNAQIRKISFKKTLSVTRKLNTEISESHQLWETSKLPGFLRPSIVAVGKC